jgi:CO dehydrogenase nickel-insertion accessory protein CooC1
MPKILFCGKGGSGKSTLLSLLALFLSEHHDVLVIDADESNPGLARMMGLDAPRQTLMENLGGKTAFRRSMGKKRPPSRRRIPWAARFARWQLCPHLLPAVRAG